MADPDRQPGHPRPPARASACKLSIDDFGTGYSSLGRLRELPIARGQDRQVVRPADSPPTTATAPSCASTSSWATPSTCVVAEGVEDEQTLRLPARRRLRPGAGLLHLQAAAGRRVRRLGRPPGCRNSAGHNVLPMCTVLLRFDPDATWPVLLAAVRDEYLARPWEPPAEHWPGRLGGATAPAADLAGRGPGPPAVTALLNGFPPLPPARRPPDPGLPAAGPLPPDDVLRAFDAFHLVRAEPDRGLRDSPGTAPTSPTSSWSPATT